MKENAFVCHKLELLHFFVPLIICYSESIIECGYFRTFHLSFRMVTVFVSCFFL